MYRSTSDKAVSTRDMAQTAVTRRDEEQSRLLRMIDEMPIAVMTVDPVTFAINYVNETSKTLIRSIEHLLPIKAEELLGTSIDVFHRHPEHQRRILANPANLPHNARINLGPEVLDLKVSAITASDGTYLGPMLTWAIVTKAVQAESRIHQLAHFDVLTGLANRITFSKQLEARLSEGADVSLLLIDLDGFKLVNDTRGHPVGDQLLKVVAERLNIAFDGAETLVSRLGGDEFTVLIPHARLAEVQRLAVRVLSALSMPYAIGDEGLLHLGASIGIVQAPLHGSTSKMLMRRADIALYAAKAAGKGVYKLFSDNMEARIEERHQLLADLGVSLAAGTELFVYYQPIVDVPTKKVTAREALIRWNHPQRGWVSPGVFIPIAEQSGLIDRIGAFVLSTACVDAAGWADKARVAVNVSATQLGKGTIKGAVVAALSASGLAPDRLEIEVTETAIVDDEHRSLSELHELRDMGVRIALDDFGTGYSSLTHLRAFPFDKIKIDGSFVRDAVSSPECAAVVRAVADLGKRLGVTTVAEGVETEEHFRCVVEEGCMEVQGYHFGKPAPNA